jgi:hypothetical protein
LYIYNEDLFVGMFISEVAEGLWCVTFVMAHISAIVVKLTIYSLYISSEVKAPNNQKMTQTLMKWG